MVSLSLSITKQTVISSDANKQYFALAKLQQDNFKQSIVNDMEKSSVISHEQLVLTLLRMQMEEQSQSFLKDCPHLFIFKQKDALAYEAFGALYGSTRDNFSAICEPQGRLFELPAWQDLAAYTKPDIDHVRDNTGTIRASYFLTWRIHALRATVLPDYYLAHPKQIVNYPNYWQRNKLTPLLTNATNTTAQWLQDQFSLSSDKADKIA